MARPRKKSDEELRKLAPAPVDIGVIIEAAVLQLVRAEPAVIEGYLDLFAKIGGPDREKVLEMIADPLGGRQSYAASVRAADRMVLETVAKNGQKVVDGVTALVELGVAMLRRGFVRSAVGSYKNDSADSEGAASRGGRTIEVPEELLRLHAELQQRNVNRSAYDQLREPELDLLADLFREKVADYPHRDSEGTYVTGDKIETAELNADIDLILQALPVERSELTEVCGVRAEILRLRLAALDELEFAAHREEMGELAPWCAVASRLMRDQAPTLWATPDLQPPSDGRSLGVAIASAVMHDVQEQLFTREAHALAKLLRSNSYWQTWARNMGYGLPGDPEEDVPQDDAVRGDPVAEDVRPPPAQQTEPVKNLVRIEQPHPGAGIGTRRTLSARLLDNFGDSQ